jgi:hypothetical protein
MQRYYIPLLLLSVFVSAKGMEPSFKEEEAKALQEFENNKGKLEFALQQWPREENFQRFGFHLDPTIAYDKKVNNNLTESSPVVPTPVDSSIPVCDRRITLYFHGQAPHCSGSKVVKKIRKIERKIKEKEKEGVFTFYPGLYVALNSKDGHCYETANGSGYGHLSKNSSLGQYDEVKPYLYFVHYLVNRHGITSLDLHGDCLGGRRLLTMLAFLYQTTRNTELLQEIEIYAEDASRILHVIKGIYLICPIKSIEAAAGAALVNAVGDYVASGADTVTIGDLASRLVFKKKLIPAPLAYASYGMSCINQIPMINNVFGAALNPYTMPVLSWVATRHILPRTTLFNLSEHIAHDPLKMLQGAHEEYSWHIFLATLHADPLIGNDPIRSDGTLSVKDREFFDSLPALNRNKTWVPWPLGKTGEHMVLNDGQKTILNLIRYRCGSSCSLYNLDDKAKLLNEYVYTGEHFKVPL